MCQESWKMEGSGCLHPRPSDSSWSQTVYTLKDIASKYNDTNLPKYLFVHEDYRDETIGLDLKTGDLLEVFGFHSVPCVSGEYDAGQQGMHYVSIPLTYEGKLRRLPKCEYQFPSAQDLVRHFPKFVRVTFTPRPKQGPLGLGEVLELVKADKEALHVKRNGENLSIPLSCRGDFEEILFKDTKDYDLRSLINNYLCPMWAQLTEMKRIREGFTGFKHFSGEVKLNYVMDEKLLLCRIVNEEATSEDQEKVEVMSIPLESACRNWTSPMFKVPTGILKHSQRLCSALPDWDLDRLHDAVRVVNFVTNHKASLHPRKCNIIVSEEDAESATAEITSSSMADAPPRSVPVPPPRRKKQLKATLSDGDYREEVKDSTTARGPHSTTELERIVSGPMDNNFIAYWRNKEQQAKQQTEESQVSSSNESQTPGRDEKMYASTKKTPSAQSSIPDTPPPTPPRIDLDTRPPPPPPLPSRSFARPGQTQSGPPLPPQSSKPTYLTSKHRALLPPELPTTPRPCKPSVHDCVPPPVEDVRAGYLDMSGSGDKDDELPCYFNDSFGHGSHPRPPSPCSDDGQHKKAFSGPLNTLDRKAWEREIPTEDETEDFYTIADSNYEQGAEVIEDEYLCMTFPGRTSPLSHAPTHIRPPALPPRFGYSASSNSSTATWSSGYNSDTLEGSTITTVSDISSIPHNVSCLSVNALAESLALLKLEKLADTCRDHFVDGVIFATLTAEDLRGEPFNLSGFHLKKALMFKDEGWTPKIK